MLHKPLFSKKLEATEPYEEGCFERLKRSVLRAALRRTLLYRLVERWPPKHIEVGEDVILPPTTKAFRVEFIVFQCLLQKTPASSRWGFS